METIDKNHAHEGLKLIKVAILECLQKHPQGIGNSDIAKELKLESDFLGKQKNYLTYSVLGLLLKENKIITEKIENNRFFYLNNMRENIK
jgi:hypothetical protein